MKRSQSRKPKVVILCGGAGARLKEETEFRPKPLVEVGGKPILWHIMKIYSEYGFYDFVLCLGYKGNMIKRYFLDYFYAHSDFTMNLGAREAVKFHGKHQENHWNITLADTGLETPTGGRVKMIEPYIDTDPFFVTYGDGVANIDLDRLLKFHRKHGRIATLTGVRPQIQFGIVRADASGEVSGCEEKPKFDHWVNGGFFCFNRKVFKYLKNNTMLEREPFTKLAKDRQMCLYPHKGFWKCMDTFKDLEELNAVWSTRKAPWKIWKN